MVSFHAKIKIFQNYRIPEGLPVGQYILKLKLYANWGNSVEAVKSVSLQESFGIGEIDRSGFIIFPNPAKNIIYLNIPSGVNDFSVSINDMAGKIVFEKNITGFHSGENYPLSIPTLQTVTYLLTLSGSGLKYCRLFAVR